LLPFTTAADMNLKVIIEPRGFPTITGSISPQDASSLLNMVKHDVKHEGRKILSHLGRDDLAAFINLDIEFKNKQECSALALADYPCFIISQAENWSVLPDKFKAFDHEYWTKLKKQLQPLEVGG